MQRAVFFAILAAGLHIPGLSLAGDPPAFAQFTFRRIGVPGAEAGKRILVQIDPNAPEQVRIATTPEPELPPPPAGDDFEWFWAEVSPSLTGASPGRLQVAVNRLIDSPPGAALRTPRLQALQEIAANYGSDILKATVGTRVSPALALAVIAIESAGRADAVSGAGAAGLMQLIPATAKRFGVTDRLSATDNISGGVAYLDWLMNAFDKDPVLVLAAYNAGENAVRRHAGVPPYGETRAYVPRVLSAWTVARGLCLTPPALVTDGCVFAVQQARADD